MINLCIISYYQSKYLGFGKLKLKFGGMVIWVSNVYLLNKCAIAMFICLSKILQEELVT